MTDFNYDNSLHLKDLIPDSEIKDIEIWIKKYPGNRKRPPIMPTLKIVQEYNGNYLTTEMMQAVAEYLDVPHVAVYEVATFYSMFNLNKMGKHVLSVCTNISCSLRGSDTVVKHLEDRLNIKLGETTEDGLFSIKEVECMAACGGAPMLEVDKIYHENLTPEKIDQILSDIASIDLSESKTALPKSKNNLSESKTKLPKSKNSLSDLTIGLSAPNTRSDEIKVDKKSVDEEKSKEKVKKKAKGRKKKEILPEPIFHLTPSHIPAKKTKNNIEQELESLEKEIDEDLQKKPKKAPVKKTVSKKEPVKKLAKKEAIKKPAKKKQQVDAQPVKHKKIESSKEINKETKPDEKKMSSLERAMLRSSDNGE